MDQGTRVRADVLEDPCAQGRYPRRARLSQKRLVEALRASRRHSGLNDPKPFQRLKALAVKRLQGSLSFPFFANPASRRNGKGCIVTAAERPKRSIPPREENSDV